MEEKLIAVIEKLGAEGIGAVYLYIVLDYLVIFIFFCLVTWGVRAVWKCVKKRDFPEDNDG